jgi:hypothetical protein
VIFEDPLAPNQLMLSRGTPRLERDHLVMSGPQGRYLIPLSQVREIDASRPVRGAAVGLVIGAAVGLAVGLAAGLNSNCEIGFGCSGDRHYVGPVLGYGAALGVLGAVIGMVTSNDPVWRISPAPAAK